MNRGIQYGTINSAHLPYKFPPSKYKNIYLAGLYPSVAEEIGLPNDAEQKRPLSNRSARTRLEFLERHNLINQKDLDTWRRNKTYELEALSTSFRDDKGNPIGLGIYLIEYMRLKNIPIKPPLPPDDVLKKQFDEEAKKELYSEIEEEVFGQSPENDLRALILSLIHI